MKRKWLAFVVLFASLGLFAKDKPSFDDFTMKIVVRNQSLTTIPLTVLSTKATMMVTDGSFYYQLKCSPYHICLTLLEGSQAPARIVNDSMELAFQKKKGGLFVAHYQIVAKIPVEHFAPAVTSATSASEKPVVEPAKPQKPCKTYVFDGKDAVCAER